jgi:hypothetical protein
MIEDLEAKNSNLLENTTLQSLSHFHENTFPAFISVAVSLNGV